MIRSAIRLKSAFFQIENAYHRYRLLPQCAAPTLCTTLPLWSTATPTTTYPFSTFHSKSPVFSPLFPNSSQNPTFPHFPHQTSYRHLFTNLPDLDKKSVDKKDQPSVVAQFKKMFKDYWYVLVPVHVATSIVWYGSFYVMCKSGLDVVGMMESMGVSEKILHPLRSSDVGYYALAYAMYKIATPARYTVTVGGTGYTVKVLQQKGILTAAEVKEQIKDTAEDLKEGLEDRLEDTREHVKEGVQNLKGKYGDLKEDAKDRLEDRRDKVKESVHNLRESYVDKLDDAKESVHKFRKKLTIRYKDKK